MPICWAGHLLASACRPHRRKRRTGSSPPPAEGTLLDEINAHLADQGLQMRASTIAEATITAAPSSTKNGKGERDPDMQQTKKGNQ
jgi:hypothetical protein